MTTKETLTCAFLTENVTSNAIWTNAFSSTASIHNSVHANPSLCSIHRNLCVETGFSTFSCSDLVICSAGDDFYPCYGYGYNYGYPCYGYGYGYCYGYCYFCCRNPCSDPSFPCYGCVLFFSSVVTWIVTWILIWT